MTLRKQNEGRNVRQGKLFQMQKKLEGKQEQIHTSVFQRQLTWNGIIYK